MQNQDLHSHLEALRGMEEEGARKSPNDDENVVRTVLPTLGPIRCRKLA